MDQITSRPQAFGRRRLLTAGVAAGVALPGLTPGRAGAAVRQAAATSVEGNVTATNIRDYGATGDGVTDDTAAIQGAIDATLARGAGLYTSRPGAT